MSIRITILLYLLFAVSSCTIEKQLYSHGFHVEFRKKLPQSRANELTTIQATTETPEIEQQITVDPNPVTDTTMLEELQEVSLNRNTELISENQSVPRRSMVKPFIEKHLIQSRDGVQSNFSGSLKSKLLKENQGNKRSKNAQEFDWEEFGDWFLIVGLILGVALFLSLITPGMNFLQALALVLLAILAFLLFLWLIFSAFDSFRFEWFWSGR